jgi:hypothetical protein
VNNVYIVISESQPVNGTYPASGIESVHGSMAEAWCALDDIATRYELWLKSDETTFYVPDASLNLEKLEYVEYRIEEHEVKYYGQGVQ